MEEEGIDTRDLIIESYLAILKEKKRMPVVSDFTISDVGRGKIRHHFGNIANLHEYMSNNYKDVISEYFTPVTDAFGRETVINKTKFVITTAVADAMADIDFLRSLKSYCSINNAQIVIMPCESITNSFENQDATFDREFNSAEYNFITDDTDLNDTLTLGSIQVSAKQIKSITGLQRIGKRDGAYIFASPKQFLEYVPYGNDREQNYAIMTTGACTKPQYYSERFVSKRLSYIASHDHQIGAIIVEIEDDKAFHFRQIQADGSGSFIDLGVQYNPDGTVKKVPVHVVGGDIHGVNRDKEVIDAFCDAISVMDVKSFFMHDIFDGISVNHHNNTIGGKAKLVANGNHDLKQEIVDTWEAIEEIMEKSGADKGYIVRSNHDEFLDRYLDEGRYIDDPNNHYTAVQIAPSLFEGELPLKRAFRLFVGENDLWDKLEFLTRESSVRIGGVELGSHGDLGMNGAKSSINSLEKIYGNVVSAHVHGAAIQRGVFRVGTFTLMDMGYNRGPSSWTHTGCLVYENGQRQLLNYVRGKFYKDMGQTKPEMSEKIS